MSSSDFATIVAILQLRDYSVIVFHFWHRRFYSQTTGLLCRYLQILTLFLFSNYGPVMSLSPDFDTIVILKLRACNRVIFIVLQRTSMCTSMCTSMWRRLRIHPTALTPRTTYVIVTLLTLGELTTDLKTNTDLDCSRNNWEACDYAAFIIHTAAKLLDGSCAICDYSWADNYTLLWLYVVKLPRYRHTTHRHLCKTHIDWAIRALISRRKKY